MTEKYSKEEREAWDAFVRNIEASNLAENVYFYGDEFLKARRERFGARPDEQEQEWRDEQEERVRKIAEAKEKADRLAREYLDDHPLPDDKPKTVKRSELKAGEFYRFDGALFLAMRYRNPYSKHYVDWSFESDGQPSYDFVSDNDLVTPCPPPGWFAEIWERRKPNQDSETFDFAEAMRRMEMGRVTQRKSNKGYPVNQCRVDNCDTFIDGDGNPFEFITHDIEAGDWMEVGDE